MGLADRFQNYPRYVSIPHNIWENLSSARLIRTPGFVGNQTTKFWFK